MRQIADAVAGRGPIKEKIFRKAAWGKIRGKKISNLNNQKG